MVTRKWKSLILVLLGGLVVISTLEVTNLYGQDLGNLLTGLTRTVKGKKVGPEKFFIIEERIIRNACGIPYHRVETGLSGSVEGYTVKYGTRSELFVDEPEIQLAQRDNYEERFHGIGWYRSEKEKKSGMTIFYPSSEKGWNGKMFVIVHGTSWYPEVGELIPRKCGQFTPYTAENYGYVGLLVDKGYAVAFTRRCALNPRTVYQERGQQISKEPPKLDERDRVRMESVTLDDGTVLEGKAFNFHAGLIRDYTLVAKNFIKSRLGRKPDKTYFYGHSSGGAMGRCFNYLPSLNLDPEGKPVFDGLLLDDAAGGLFLPTMYVKGKDVLFQKDADKRYFVPQIDIAHMAYIGDEFKGGDYLFNKRKNQRILNAKGLGAKSRIYEIMGVSHNEAGRQGPKERPQNIDLGGIFDVIIDILDRWVDRGIEPPPSRSNSYDLGDMNRDGINENPSIALPEIACPIGVYYNFPKGSKRSDPTAFEPYLRESKLVINANTQALPEGFDEKWLEPINEFGYLVDMNGNGVRDTKESITEAWQRRAREGYRTGVLGNDEVLTHEKYVSCVCDVATNLYKQGFLSGNAMTYYIEQAIRSDIGK